MSDNEITKLQEEVEESALIEKEQKFCPAKFGIGLLKLITSAEFLVFVLVVVLYIIYAPKESVGFFIALCAVGGVFMFFKPLSRLIGRGNMNVNLGANASINKNIQGEK